MRSEPASRRESVAMLAVKSAKLIVKALTTQPISIRPFSMNLSSRASTRTNTAASAKNADQRQ